MNKLNHKRTLLFLTLIVSTLTSATWAADDLRTKEFLVMGYQGLQMELRSTEGPYVRTLMDLLNIGADDTKKALDDIKVLAKKFPNIMDFADAVLKLRNDVRAEEAIRETVVLPTGPTVYSGDKLDNALNHLTKGMKITVYLKTGQQFTGQFEEYNVKRLRMKSDGSRSFHINDILALDAANL